jgi:hypothetical protein
LVIVHPSSATAIAPCNAGLFQVLDHELAKPVVPRDGIVYCRRNKREDYLDVDVDKVGPKAMRRSRSHTNVSGRYISTHSSTNSVDEEDNFLLYL